MMERVWAKMGGSYESSSGGLPSELYDLIGSVPTTVYSCVNDTVLLNDATTTFNLIQ
jgi:hypothetical protein